MEKLIAVMLNYMKTAGELVKRIQKELDELENEDFANYSHHLMVCKKAEMDQHNRFYYRFKEFHFPLNFQNV